jgi:hypothetical protein
MHVRHTYRTRTASALLLPTTVDLRRYVKADSAVARFVGLRALDRYDETLAGFETRPATATAAPALT